ncbi:MAG: carbohydrate kinase family protein [Candidatus Helarchaeota archaeon]|nr:carbohydrate kinase family protein [Candidatus Helarchaeota archaeon]
MKLDMVGVGLTCVDLVMKVDRFPKIDENVVGSDFNQFFGGVAANTTITLARLGLATGFIGKIGNDQFGTDMIEAFKKEKVDVNNIIVEEGRSPLSLIMVDKKGRRIISHYPSKALLLFPKEVELKKDYLLNSKIVHLDGVPLLGAIKVGELLKDTDTMVSHDMSAPLESFTKFGIKLEDILKLINLCDIFIPCELALKSLTKEDDVMKAVKKVLTFGPKIAGTTLGSKGCIIATEEEIIRQPAFKVKVRDTTGAGDSFHGGFIYGILKGWDLNKVAEFASAVAALACKKFGSRSSLPKLDEVNEFLKNAEPLEVNNHAR